MADNETEHHEEETDRERRRKAGVTEKKLSSHGKDGVLTGVGGGEGGREGERASSPVDGSPGKGSNAADFVAAVQGAAGAAFPTFATVAAALTGSNKKKKADRDEEMHKEEEKEKENEKERAAGETSIPKAPTFIAPALAAAATTNEPFTTPGAAAADVDEGEGKKRRLSAAQLSSRLRYLTYPAILWEFVCHGMLNQACAKAIIEKLDEECGDKGRKTRQEYLHFMIQGILDGDNEEALGGEKKKKKKMGGKKKEAGEGFTWKIFRGLREMGYTHLFQELLDQMEYSLLIAVYEEDLRPLGYEEDEGEEVDQSVGRVEEEVKGAVLKCLHGDARVSAAVVAAEAAVMGDGRIKNKDEEVPVRRLEVVLKFLVEVFDEEEVYKCVNEALDELESTVEEQAFGEPRALTVRRCRAGDAGWAEWEAWMARDKEEDVERDMMTMEEEPTGAMPARCPPAFLDALQKEESSASAATAAAARDTADDGNDDAGDEARTTRFHHLTELAFFQEIVQRGLISKATARHVVEVMDRLCHDPEASKQYILKFLQQVCEKAATPEKRPHQKEFSRLMHETMSKVVN